MKRRTMGVLALAVLAVLAFLPADRAYATFNTCKDRKDGFSFRYPEEWAIADGTVIGNMSVAVYAKPVDNFAASFNVVVTQPQGVPEATEAAVEKSYRSLMTDLEILSFKKDIFRDEPCIIVEYIWTQGVHKLHQRQYLVDHGNKGYSLTFTALQSNFGEYERDFGTILDSFEF